MPGCTQTIKKNKQKKKKRRNTYQLSSVNIRNPTRASPSGFFFKQYFLLTAPVNCKSNDKNFVGFLGLI